MRILFVNSAREGLWGGGEKWTIAAAAWFRNAGYETAIVGRPRSRLIAAAEQQKLSAMEMNFGGDADPASMLRARRIIKQFHPDLIVVNFNKEGFHFGIAAAFFSVPVIARHGFPLLRGAAHHRTLIHRLYRKLVVNADSIRDCYKELGFRVDDVEIIYNGVAPVSPDREMWRKTWKLGEDELLIVAAGRLETQKRFDRFLQIAKLISAKIPAARFAVLGDGPMLAELQKLATELGLERGVVFPGFDPQFASRIASANLFLLTSEAEGTPNVVLEAMSAGVATLAMSCGSLPAILSGELSRNLFVQDDLQSMSERALVLLRDESMRHQFAEWGQTHVREHFSLDASFRRYEALFRAVSVRFA